MSRNTLCALVDYEVVKEARFLRHCVTGLLVLLDKSRYLTSMLREHALIVYLDVSKIAKLFFVKNGGLEIL